MPRISWINTGSEYRRMEGDIVNIPAIPPGIYEVQLDLSGWSLIKTADSFVFPYKVYNLEGEFLEHVKKTYNSLNGNIGILFNGTKGTGKSVSAKILANELKLPVIIVKSMGGHNPGQISYLSSFNFDCIFFFDEFEKQFNDGDCSILQFMDGIYTSEYRRIFLLTTNELSINENLLSRPSRIRYVREFGNLDKKIVEEYLDDNLVNQDCRQELLDYVDTLTISTIDILKSIVEEVNVHGINEFLKIRKSFNVSTATYTYRAISGRITSKKVNQFKYNIEKFLEDANRFDSRFDIQTEMNAAIAKTRNDQEEQEVRDKFDALLRYTANMNRNYFDDVDKAWNKLIPNKDYFNDKLVIGIDLEKHIVVTVEGDGDVFNYYLICNYDERPSLYKKAGLGDYAYML